MKKATILLFFAILSLGIGSCSKPAGQGGDSKITGKVWVKNYNSTFTLLNQEYPGADVDVYIIYGNEATYGDKISCGPDGVFEFPYLRKGSYRIYAYSKDKEAYLAGNTNAPDKAVFVDAEITDKKQTVDAGTITINN